MHTDTTYIQHVALRPPFFAVHALQQLQLPQSYTYTLTSLDQPSYAAGPSVGKEARSDAASGAGCV
eukprot:COSAG01_NODE_12263_length_1770_cov_4.520646_3_plen_65_part_01